LPPPIPHTDAGHRSAPSPTRVHPPRKPSFPARGARRRSPPRTSGAARTHLHLRNDQRCAAGLRPAGPRPIRAGSTATITSAHGPPPWNLVAAGLRNGEITASHFCASSHPDVLAGVRATGLPGGTTPADVAARSPAQLRHREVPPSGRPWRRQVLHMAPAPRSRSGRI
jgi:hypothetical protein